MRIRAIGLALLMVTSVSLAQQPPVFRAIATGVRVHVTVVDRGQRVSGLGRDDFELRDNGVRQTIDLVAESDRVDMAVLIDRSASLAAAPLARLRGVAGALLRLMTERDAVTLFAFSGTPTPLAPRQLGATGLAAVIERVQPLTQSRTALWDAVVASSASMAGAAAHPYVAVLTDGCDNASWLTPAETGMWLGRLDVTVDIFWLGSSQDERRLLNFWADLCHGPLRLEDATRPNAGRVFRTADRDLDRHIASRLDELRSGYFLSYVPAGVKSDDGWHKIEVMLKSAKGRATARPGYFTGPSVR